MMLEKRISAIWSCIEFKRSSILFLVWLWFLFIHFWV